MKKKRRKQTKKKKKKDTSKVLRNISVPTIVQLRMLNAAIL